MTEIIQCTSLVTEIHLSDFLSDILAVYIYEAVMLM